MLAKQLMYPVVSGLYPQLCCMRLPLLVLVFVCLCVFSACLLSDAPGGAKAEFPTEAVECRWFCFYRSVLWLLRHDPQDRKDPAGMSFLRREH